MTPWPPRCYQRATAFVTDPAHRLLVFDHLDDPGVPTQVPAGGIEPGELPEVAVQRELAEESGISTARVVRKLGESWFVANPGDVPAGLEEQMHHAFHLHVDAPPSADSWEWDDCDGGDVVAHRLAFRWADLAAAGRVLHPSQAMWISTVRNSLAHAERSGH